MAQVLELPNRNDKVVDFRWEPRGSRFAVLHGEGPKPALSVYAMNDMRTSARGVQHLGSQPGKQANCIHWSPQVRAACAPHAVQSGGREALQAQQCGGLTPPCAQLQLQWPLCLQDTCFSQEDRAGHRAFLHAALSAEGWGVCPESAPGLQATDAGCVMGRARTWCWAG